MNEVLLEALLATLVISLISLAGIATFVFKEKTTQKISMYLVAFSTGTLIGGAFFHLLPEAVELQEGMLPFAYLIVGISAFFVLERVLKWHHCHEEKECKVHTFTHMSLIGDGLHNFLDGLIIVSAFYLSTELGIVTTAVVAAHELPQEIGDFGILIHGGFSRAKALLWNFISAATALVGTVVGFFMINSYEGMQELLIPFAAGGFIYIAMSDLIPELHKEEKLSKSILNFFLFAIGIIMMIVLKQYFGE